MLLTGKLPAEGELWEAFKSRLPFTFFQAGGIQVDILFMLSGFLLVYNLMRKSTLELPTLGSHTLRRALRMMPMMTVSIILGHFVMKDCWGEPYTYWDGGKAIFPTRVMSYLLFYTNYCNQITHGSFLGSLMWSCAVDLQVGVFMLVVIKLCASFYKHPSDKTALLRLLKVVFAVLLVVACLIRGSFFDEQKVNMVQLGQYFHFRMLQPSSSYTWMENFFGHEWQTTANAIDKTHEYLTKMYFPTHTRFGPFMVGGVVACSLLLAQDSCKVNKDRGKITMGTVMAWICTGMAAVQLIVPCLPAPPIEETPLEAQLFVTAALRNLSACSSGFLLFRALVPEEHSWHSPLLASFLSLPLWKPIAAISFCSYLVHFRLLMEVIYSVPMQERFGLVFPALSAGGDTSTDDLATEWLMLMGKVFMVGIAVSFVVAKILHEVVERPTARAVEKYVFPRDKSSKVKKVA